MTKEQRIEEFKKDLQAVLDKHRATISVAESDNCIENPKIEVYMNAIWGEYSAKEISPGVSLFFDSMEYQVKSPL